MKETEEIQIINSLSQRAKTLAFDDFVGLQKLQDDMKNAHANGLIDMGVQYQLILIFLERIDRGECDEVAERLYGIKVDRPNRNLKQ